MNTRLIHFMIAFLGIALLGLAGCSDDDETLSPFSINFASAELGISPENTQADVVINFSRPATVSGSIRLSLQPGTLTYGESGDYYISVAPGNDVITLPFVSGDQSVSFTIFAGNAVVLKEDKTLDITIMEDSGTLFNPGTATQVTVIFAENFVSPGANLEIDGGGPDQPFQVFIDLSKQTQVQVDKYSWDLGFSTATDVFSVILNGSAEVMARQLDETDIDAVTANDTTGFAANMYLSNYNDTEASEWVDNQNGSFDDTAIEAITATGSDNRVYIVKRDGAERNWKKVRILRNGDNYILQYADIAASTHQEITINKDEAFNFIYADLDDGIVQAEPEKESWDLMYGTYSGVAFFGVPLAISFNDIVTINRSGISAIKIEESSGITYDDFTTEDVSDYTLIDDDIFVIGDTWRGLEAFALVLKTDVFYLVKDAQGNMYKLKFTSLTTNDQRGFPQFIYELL